MAEDKALPLCGNNSKKQVKGVGSHVLSHFDIYMYIKIKKNGIFHIAKLLGITTTRVIPGYQIP
jgi:hypothetical protein